MSIMRRVLYERFGELGMGEPDPQPRPIIGSQHVAGGFVIPALLGAEIWFEKDAAPQPLPMEMSIEQIEAFEKPDFRTTWPMNEFIEQMDALEAEWGYVVGGMNTDGLLNAAYHLYGQQLFLDFYAAPDRVRRSAGHHRRIDCGCGALFAPAHRRLLNFCQSDGGTRGPDAVFPCQLLGADDLAQKLPGHSSGSRAADGGAHSALRYPSLRRQFASVAPVYAELPLTMVDVGWGSDVTAVRQSLPNVFLNLRLNPVRMLQATPQEIAADTENLLKAAGPLENVGVCCINMDYETPDENIFAMFEVVEKYRQYGG